MRPEDIPQVKEIDLEAFPSWKPLTNYERELQNQMAHYLIAYSESEETTAARGNSADGENEGKKGTSGLSERLRRLLLPVKEEKSQSTKKIVGFAGFWVMAGEAHIISIAVRREYQRHGIGRMLMIFLMQLAAQLEANFITLEARISNTGAHELYRQCGFSQRGIRKCYYTDNREDAVVMSTEDTGTRSFQELLKKLERNFLSQS
jgi:ribosomal-protein-alanine N-acetyltransferase